MSDTTGIPAAWYPDPGDAGQLRYWDGNGWTGQVVPNPAAALAPAPVAAPPPAQSYEPEEPYQLEQPYQPEQSYGSNKTAPLYSPAYTPLSHIHDPIEPLPQNFDEGTANTLAAWLYAVFPLLVVVQLYLPLPARPDELFADAGALTTRGGLAIATLVFAIVLAAADRHALRERGFESAPAAALGLVPPILVVARLLAVGVRGVAVAIVALLIQAGSGFLLVTQLPALMAASTVEEPAELSSEGMIPPFTAAESAYLLTPEGMAKKILFDAHNTALSYDTVECVPLTSTELGAQTTCEAKSTIADYLIRVQVLDNNDGTPFIVTTVTPSIHA